MKNVQRLTLIFGVVMIIVATLLPFGGMPAALIPPRWCVRCGGLWLTDAISNVVLFVPLGIALALRGWRWWRVALAALIGSVFVESMQAIGLPPGRSAAVADLITNTLGGLLGVPLLNGWRAQRELTSVSAARLSIGWTVLTITVFTLTTLALGPRESTPNTTDAFATSVSPFEHVPGHPWYEGINDSAFVDTAHFTKGWSGPFISQVNRELTPLHAGVTVRQTDPSWERTPLLFVHLPNDSAALLMIAKHGNNAQLLVSRRAWDWGLAFPVADVPNAFANRSLKDPRPLSFIATATSDALRIESRGAFAGSGTVRLSPILGWALIQTIVTVQSPLAPALLAGWLFALLAPVGWWSVKSERRWMGASACLAVLGSLVALPWWKQVHALTVAELLLVCSCMGAGALLALLHRKRQLSHGARRESPAAVH
ncbi:VanZ family protein [Gemmatimonas phototrophica]|uniref:VanZ family protein n=1 Tax=Gemmatimonas phototrophica TaxID=1379270 RepID=UPI0006A70A42|nr:VanZ family protein [Gemmatimonas phototrophica]